jgi:hypothetical protein
LLPTTLLGCGCEDGEAWRLRLDMTLQVRVLGVHGMCLLVLELVQELV